VALTLGVALVVIWLTGDDTGDIAGDTVGGGGVVTTVPPLSATTATPGTTVPVVTTAPPVIATVPPVTVAPASRCAGVASMTLPVGVELAGGPGNFDGPPEPASIMDADSAFVFQSAGAWYLAFSLDIGYLVFEPLPASSIPGFEPVLLVWDFEGDDGALVKVDQSTMSGAEVYVWYYLDAGCQVEDAGTIDADPKEFLDWFGASHTQAFACATDGVFETSAAKTAGTMWDVRDVFYHWTAPAGPGFEFGFEDGVEVPEGDPLIAAAGLVDC
jgi:hypothetical protein